MKKFLLAIIVLIVNLSAFDYTKIYKLSDFKHFKIYKPEGSFLEYNLKLPKGKLNEEQVKKLIYLYQKEKMVRDLLLILNEKYYYRFMIYIAMLTQKHISILDLFLKKYDLQIPKYEYIVGKYEDKNIQNEYQELLKESIKSEVIAANLSVKFMTELINLYSDLLDTDLPEDLENECLKLNSFNIKVLRKFKKGLRNIEIGLPIE